MPKLYFVVKNYNKSNKRGNNIQCKHCKQIFMLRIVILKKVNFNVINAKEKKLWLFKNKWEVLMNQWQLSFIVLHVIIGGKCDFVINKN